MISVPVAPETVLNTINQFPRIPREAGLIPVQLKRKLEYDRCHKKEHIDPEKIIRALDFLKYCGNPYYQFYDDLNSFKKRCKEHDEEGYQMIFGSEISDAADIESDSNDDDNTDTSDDEKD